MVVNGDDDDHPLMADTSNAYARNSTRTDPFNILPVLTTDGRATLRTTEDNMVKPQCFCTNRECRSARERATERTAVWAVCTNAWLDPKAGEMRDLISRSIPSGHVLVFNRDSYEITHTRM